MTNTPTPAVRERGPITHEVKCWPVPFSAVKSGAKPWELRKNDRDYRVGDTLIQHEWEPDECRHTGDSVKHVIGWALYGPAFGLPDDYVIMSLAAQPSAGAEPVAVIAFREGCREAEFLSWNAMPIGEHRLYTHPAPALTAGDGLHWVERYADGGGVVLTGYDVNAEDQAEWDVVHLRFIAKDGSATARSYATPVQPDSGGVVLSRERIEALFEPLRSEDDERYGNVVNGTLDEARDAILAALAPVAAEGGKRKGIYVASRASNPDRPAMWRTLRDVERHPIISTWIDEAGPGESHDLSDLWERIAREVTSAARLVLYAEADDFPLKGAFIEVGMALAAGVPVYVVLPGVDLEPRSMRPLGSWAKHPLVTFYDTVEAALRTEPTGGGETEDCPICAVTFKPDDLCATDITEGTCHAACLKGSPIVDMDTGEPTDADPFTYRYDSLQTGGGEGA